MPALDIFNQIRTSASISDICGNPSMRTKPSPMAHSRDRSNDAGKLCTYLPMIYSITDKTLLVVPLEPRMNSSYEFSTGRDGWVFQAGIWNTIA